ncbi:hypothetical protein RRG08_047664 [Elysia crispata]|uniref:Uncharacterized protein n=1 Tax=Elysia crispata TaxID=231223 RepID=A0AAE1EEB5_9GAST|nr:hypothetical protein RRG08_047664 [Elysia crispata]
MVLRGGRGNHGGDDGGVDGDDGDSGGHGDDVGNICGNDVVVIVVLLMLVLLVMVVMVMMLVMVVIVVAMGVMSVICDSSENIDLYRDRTFHHRGSKHLPHDDLLTAQDQPLDLFNTGLSREFRDVYCPRMPRSSRDLKSICIAGSNLSIAKSWVECLIWSLLHWMTMKDTLKSF